MEPIRAIWGRRIHQARLAAGLTQVQLAAASGLLQQSISDWETGKWAPKLEHRGRLARALGVDPNELFALPPEDTNGGEAAA